MPHLSIRSVAFLLMLALPKVHAQAIADKPQAIDNGRKSEVIAIVRSQRKESVHPKLTDANPLLNRKARKEVVRPKVGQPEAYVKGSAKPSNILISNKVDDILGGPWPLIPASSVLKPFEKLSNHDTLPQPICDHVCKLMKQVKYKINEAEQKRSENEVQLINNKLLACDNHCRFMKNLKSKLMETHGLEKGAKSQVKPVTPEKKKLSKEQRRERKMKKWRRMQKKLLRRILKKLSSNEEFDTDFFVEVTNNNRKRSFE